MPYWIYRAEGGVSIERRVPMLPFSSECRRLPKLKADLALYRLAFGQPRQEDLLAYIQQVSGDSNVDLDLDELRIRLAP